MKAPAFQWYAAEYLADEQVAQLSLESEAVYVRLLSYCWREGTIPANPLQCVALCKYADVKVIKPALALFMKAPGRPGRLIHKRLEEERAKQQAFKDKQLINGKLGGRPRKPNDNPDETQPKRLGYSGLTQTEPKKRSSSSSSTSCTTDVVPQVKTTTTEQALKAKTPKQIAELLTGDNDLYTADTVPMLNDPRLFGIVLARYGYGHVDAATYQQQIRATCQAKEMNAGVAQFESFIKAYLNGDKQKGRLLLPLGHGLTPNEIPGNWDTARQGAYTAPMGQGIPHPSSYLKPEFLPR